MKRKFLIGFLTASMVLNMTGAPALAAEKTYQDGTWTGTAVVQPEDPEDPDFDPYNITVNVQVTNGKISAVTLDPSTGIIKSNQKYYNRASKVYEQIVANGSTEGIDAVSSATCTSAAIFEAVSNALAGHEAVPSDDPAPSDEDDGNKDHTGGDVDAPGKDDSGSGDNTDPGKTDEDVKPGDDDSKDEDAGKDDPGKKEDEKESGKEVYVMMNIPYSAFYAAEGTSDVDAVTSATFAKTKSTLAAGSYHVNSDGSDITGITYPVKVSDASVLKDLKQVTDADSLDITVKLRGQETTNTYTGKDALFENPSYAYYTLSEEPSFYKELTVNADGSFSFGAAAGSATAKTVNAELLAGSDTGYGDYEIDVTDYTPEKIYGAVLNTKEGGAYGLKHVENIWRNFEFAISTGHTTTVHGCPVQVYEGAEGQTAVSITLFTDNGVETLNFAEELYLAPVTEFTASAEDANTVAVQGLPADMQNPKASVTWREGTGRNAVTHTVAEDAEVKDGKIVLSEALTDGTQYTVSVKSDNYAPSTASFTYEAPSVDPTDEEPVIYSIIEGADGTWTKGSETGYKFVSDADFAKFVDVLVDGVTVNTDSYIAESGSTEVTLKPDYLETLSEGQHTASIVSNDGSAETTLTVKEAEPADPEDPNKGEDDNNNPENPGKSEDDNKKPENPDTKDDDNKKPENPDTKGDDNKKPADSNNTDDSKKGSTGTNGSASASNPGKTSVSAGRTSGTASSGVSAGRTGISSQTGKVNTGDTAPVQAAAYAGLLGISAAVLAFLMKFRRRS